MPACFVGEALSLGQKYSIHLFVGSINDFFALMPELSTKQWQNQCWVYVVLPTPQVFFLTINNFIP
jgi:hypothetical protein